jgi:hypothetical protein
MNEFTDWITNSHDVEMSMDEFEFLIGVFQDRPFFGRVARTLALHAASWQLQAVSTQSGTLLDQLRPEFLGAFSDAPSVESLNASDLDGISLNTLTVPILSDALPHGLLPSVAARLRMLSPRILAQPPADAPDASAQYTLLDLSSAPCYRALEAVLSGALLHLQVAHLAAALDAASLAWPLYHLRRMQTLHSGAEALPASPLLAWAAALDNDDSMEPPTLAPAAPPLVAEAAWVRHLWARTRALKSAFASPAALTAAQGRLLRAATAAAMQAQPAPPACSAEDAATAAAMLLHCAAPGQPAAAPTLARGLELSLRWLRLALADDPAHAPALRERLLAHLWPPVWAAVARVHAALAPADGAPAPVPEAGVADARGADAAWLAGLVATLGGTARVAVQDAAAVLAPIGLSLYDNASINTEL